MNGGQDGQQAGNMPGSYGSLGSGYGAYNTQDDEATRKIQEEEERIQDMLRKKAVRNSIYDRTKNTKKSKEENNKDASNWKRFLKRKNLKKHKGKLIISKERGRPDKIWQN